MFLDCVCDPDGSTSTNCEMKTQCQCKDNVDGEFCDKCKDGKWNFKSYDPDNPDYTLLQCQGKH